MRTRRRSPWILCAAAVLATGLVPLALPAPATAAASGTSTVSLGAVKATFVQAEFATHFTVVALDLAKKPLTYKWTLTLQLVDPAGAINPSSGSHAAVDRGCNNQGKLASSSASFTWKHGDGTLGGCDHSKMGPSGHQGQVKVVVSDGTWICTALYNGTNTGVGQASTCVRLASPPSGAYTCRGPITKLFDNWNGGGVLNGARPTSFSTKGVAYCVVEMDTYHWNDAKGAAPGTVGLTSSTGSKLGPFTTKGTAGQGGAANVNWTASVATSPKPVVINGSYTCTDSSPSTWSQNGVSKGQGFCKVFVINAFPVASGTPTGNYTCSGPQKKFYDNSNTSAVLGAGVRPTFSTKGVTYCLTQLGTYHWNNAKGAAPGSIGLVSSGGAQLGPFTAKGSVGQNGAPNVNWTASVATSPKPVVINGTYSCTDSNPSTWSENAATRGQGFCMVYVKTATATSAKPGTKPGTKPKCKAGKLGIVAAPNSGKPPLAVTLALCATKIVQWRVDFGDGKSWVAIGQPPAMLNHTYARAGDYRPRLTVIASQGATSSSSVVTSVSVATAPLISLTADPVSGNPPLRVTFTMGTTVTNVTTWTIDFGDGTHQTGAGSPPASVSHSYARAGSFRAAFSVKPGQYALVYTVAAITVGAGTPPTLGLSANPSSGGHPLTVTFTLTSNIPGQVVSWTLLFGDGLRQVGSGRPPGTVTHTYAKAGLYGAVLQVSQQQQYGGVLYEVPRGGLAISVS